jgi:hypothetical protein
MPAAANFPLAAAAAAVAMAFRSRLPSMSVDS